MTKIYKIVSALFLVLIVVNELQAQIIFNEPFDYPVGNLQGNGGGTGFPVGSIWSNAGTNATAANIGTTATIESGSIVTGYGNTGNRAQVCTETGKTVFFDRAIPTTLNDDNVTDYYLSFWYKGPATLNNTHYINTIAQLILMRAPNATAASDMRFGAGKSSNVGGVNIVTAFSRATGEGCTAASTPNSATNSTTAFGTTALALPDAGLTKFVLIKITKKEFTLNIFPTAAPVPQYFDGVRIWFLDAPPTDASDAIFTNRPNGDIITNAPSGPLTGGSTTAPTAGDYLSAAPIQSRAFRPAGSSGTAPLYNSQSCASSFTGITGIRLRIEGPTGNCFEFDEFKFSIGLSGIVLPISLENVSANQVGKSNVVHWATTSESNNKGFYIEQSDNGTSWKSIGFVQGANNSTQKIQYSFTDDNPYKITYYRLRQEDNTGKITFSKIVKVKSGDNLSIEISPNPAQENINITLNKISNNNTVAIVDMQGRKILSTTFNGFKKSINIATLSKGIYFINIITENGTSVEKFVKN